MQTLKNKTLKTLLSAILLIIVMMSIPATNVLAASDTCHPEKNNKSPSKALTPKQLESCEACNKGKDPTAAELNTCLSKNPIIYRLGQIVDFLSAGVGIVVTGSIIVGGIQYAVAGGNPNAVSAAKKRIADALIALLAFLFMYAFLQWLIPGKSFINL